MLSSIWAALAVAAALSGAQPAEAPAATATSWTERDYVCFWDAYWASRPDSARRAFLTSSLDDLDTAAATLFRDHDAIPAAMRSCGKTGDGFTEEGATMPLGIMGLLTYSEHRLIADYGLTRARLEAGWAALPQDLKDRLATSDGAAADAAAEEAVDAFAVALALPASTFAERPAREIAAFYVLSRIWRTGLTS